MNTTIGIAFIIIFNSVPIFGVAFYKWLPFEAFWFFWVETLVIALFNTIRIVFSQGQPATVNTQLPLVYHIGEGTKYLLIRIFVFLFYSIFIITFIGFIATPSKDKSMVLTTILFQNTFFNLGLLISMCSQGYYLINYFFRTRDFVTSTPDNYAAIFDGRQLVIHIAVVLGALGSIFLMKNTSFGNYGAVLIISLLCVCKSIFDIFETSGAAYKIAEK